MTIADPNALVENLRLLPQETEWIEFKENWFEAKRVGQYISSLANSAMLHNERHAYLVFGVSNDTHELVGTSVKLGSKTVGAEPFESWISRLLNPRINILFVEGESDGKHFEIICIEPGYISPVRFESLAYIRIDQTTKALKDYPEKERSLWAITSRFSFERSVAESHVSEDDLLERFDLTKLLAGLGKNRQSDESTIEFIASEGLIISDNQNRYDITNNLVLLAAQDIRRFPSVSRKGVRVITYRDKSNLNAKGDVQGQKGYGLHFSRLLGYIMDRVNHREEMIHGVRTQIYDIPEIAVREIVVNAMIHQDLTTGVGPLVEIFTDRIKVTNPGKPLIDPNRFIDSPSRSRNEDLALFMMRLGLCEERGSDVDRAVTAIENQALPAPLFLVVEDSMTVTGPRSFAAMTKEERVRACYQHACLRNAANEPMRNSSLRRRLGLSDKQASQTTIVINDTLKANLIRPLDENQANRNSMYVPFWA